MHPHAVEPQAEQSLLLIGGVEHPGQRKFARRGIGEQRRRHDRGARIDERDHLMFPPLAHPAAAAIRSGISMRGGWRASASRARLGRTPSIHMVSALTWKNGALPSKGSALTTPPPVPSTASRSSEMVTWGCARDAT